MNLSKPIAEERYVFDCDWYDQQAELVRHYRLTFYPSDSSVEMYDKKIHKNFLKRVEIPNITLNDLFIGSRVSVLARVLTVTGYADIATAAKQQPQRESTFAMIKPCSYSNMGKILSDIQKQGFIINKLKMSKHNRDSVA